MRDRDAGRQGQGPNWKGRYLNALDEQERLLREHHELVSQLSRGVIRVSLACDGMDAGLDNELDRLRTYLRLGKLPATATLSRQIDLIEDRLRDLDALRESQGQRTAESFRELVRQLQDLDIASRTNRKLEKFLRLAGQRLKYSDGMTELMGDFAALQQEVLAEIGGTGDKRRGLLGRGRTGIGSGRRAG